MEGNPPCPLPIRAAGTMGRGTTSGIFMSKKNADKQVYADLSLWREMRDIAKAESRAIARRRASENARGLTPNEIARKIIEARGTNTPAFSAKGQTKIIASFWAETKKVQPAKLPLAKKAKKAHSQKMQKTVSTVYIENGPVYDTGMYDPRNGHPGYRRIE